MTNKEVEEKIEEIEDYLEDECDCGCDAKAEYCEEKPKMFFMFGNEEGYHKYPMLRCVQQYICDNFESNMFVFFNMGSITLDVENPRNHMIINDGFVEIFNDENGETTFIKVEEIKGFVFEPKLANLDDFIEGMKEDSND